MPLLTRPRVSRGPIRTRDAWRAVAAASLSVLLVASGVSAAEANGPVVSETTSTETKGAKTLPELVVSPPAPLLDELATNYDFSVLVRNPGEDALPAGTLTLSLDTERVESTKELSDTFREPGVVLKTSKLNQIDGKSERAVTVSVPRADLLLGASSAPGVYRVRAVFTPETDPNAPKPTTVAPTVPSPTTPDAADETAADISGDTPVVWRGSGGSSVKLSFIVPLVLPSNIHTMPNPDQLGEVVPKLDELLTVAISEQATLAIDPRIIAGIRAYGDESPKAARDFLKRLESTSLTTFLLQFADADPAAQSAVGLKELLEPTSLDFVTRFGTFSGSADPEVPVDQREKAPTTDATPSPTDGANNNGEATDGNATGGSGSAPTLKQLMAWPEGTSMAWPAEGEADSSTLALLEASDISTVVLDSGNVTLKGGPQASLGNTSALVTDAGLATAARDALTARTETERSAGVASAAAQLALAAQTDSQGLVLGLDRGAVAEADDPTSLIKELAALAWVTATPQTAQAKGTASLKAAGTPEDRQELLRAAVNREPSVDEFSAILVNPEYLTGYQRTRLLDLFATRYADKDADFEKVARNYRKRDAELMQGVRTINTQNTQLVGTSTRVPVQLRNSLPFDATVSVDVVPASAALSVTESHFSEVAVAAEGTSRVLVPVRSRVSSGESGLVVNVTDNSGDLTVHTTTLSISISSVVETIALWTLGVLAALLLGFGIWRSVRRRQATTKVTAPRE
ncbi:hypothetical protein G7068_09395 [Leucobacter viscericola]|uniref:Uncharacterized protein n=1 Tax=Leucobacter viscericola TaxID=2714935 RepID=A0A6G7XG85_9MICO|nr:DUF6049 family protein [Leucobacter viscericola]QIK63388.1 hypothetical protein G7068_09395 [Leucobacter viscericola]